jgi:hypothetical protein
MKSWYLFTIIGAVLTLTGANVRGSVHITEEQARQWAVSTPQPKYPEAARLRRITGLGYFKLRVNRATGRVTQITVLRSTGNSCWMPPLSARCVNGASEAAVCCPPSEKSTLQRASLSRIGISSLVFQSTLCLERKWSHH